MHVTFIVASFTNKKREQTVTELLYLAMDEGSHILVKSHEFDVMATNPHLVTSTRIIRLISRRCRKVINPSTPSLSPDRNQSMLLSVQNSVRHELSYLTVSPSCHPFLCILSIFLPWVRMHRGSSFSIG